MTTLYLDVTHTYVTGLATGIQRVVRKVTAELIHHRVTGIDRVRPVVALGGVFMLLDAGGIDRLLHPATVSGHPPMRGPASRMAAATGARLPALMDRMQQRRFARAAVAIVDEPLERTDIGAGDLVLLLDAFWGGSTTLAAARACRRRGAGIVATVYDLIPATHPAYMTPVAATLFARKLREAIELCDGFVAISQASAVELARFAGSRPVRTEVAYCGCDIAAPPASPGTVRPIADTYISVGTLEPRKGQAVILDAFQRLWARGSTSRLVFVGRRGWGVDALWRRCHALMADGAPFRLIEDADDAALARLLEESSAAIVASEVEGFGLPVVEALSRDLPVFASDIPVFREIANGAISFFPASDPDALATAIDAFERDPEPMREAARRFTWLSWHEAAPGYAQAALRIHQRTRRDAAHLTEEHR